MHKTGEPRLQDLLDDQVVHLMMERDGVSREEIESLFVALRNGTDPLSALQRRGQPGAARPKTAATIGMANGTTHAGLRLINRGSEGIGMRRLARRNPLRSIRER